MSYFEDVFKFQADCGLPVTTGRAQILSDKDMMRRLRLISEELTETIEAHTHGDMVKFADGLADLVWVVLGTAVEAGIPFDAVWAEVRRSNMTKVGGTFDAGGKLQKPPGFSRADLEPIMQAAMV